MDEATCATVRFGCDCGDPEIVMAPITESPTACVVAGWGGGPGLYSPPLALPGMWYVSLSVRLLSSGSKMEEEMN